MFASVKVTFCVAESLQRGGQEGRSLQSIRSDAPNHRDRVRQRADQDTERRESDTVSRLLKEKHSFKLFKLLKSFKR